MKNISKNKIYMIFGITLLVIALAGSAYAYYSATASASISGTVAGSANLDLKVEKISTGATGNLIPVDNDTTTLTKAVIGEANTSYDNSKRCIDKNGYSACQIYKITLTNKSSVSVSVDGGVTLSGDNTPNIECAKMDDINTVSSNSSCKGNKTLTKNYTMDANASVVYYIMVYIKNIDGVQTDTGDFSGTVFFNAGNGNKIDADFSDKNIIDEKASTYITSLYNDATKTTVTNNSITYQYDTTDNLMQDTAGNIRYYGASPSNYIYFNCSDYSNQTSSTCELWRIIGVFDGKVKLVKNGSINNVAYDSTYDARYLQSPANDASDSVAVTLQYDKATVELLAIEVEEGGGNDYSESTLQKILNNYYYNCLKAYGYYQTYDFTSTGIKNDITRNMISEAIYYLGGWNTSNVYSNIMYEKERGTSVPSGHSTTWPGNIALAYPSDYGYAADFNSCSGSLSAYNDNLCTSNNWMYPVITNVGSSNGWLLTPNSGSWGSVWIVNSSGYVDNNGNSISAYGASPTLYLTSDTVIESGEGTSTLPYTLSVN